MMQQLPPHPAMSNPPVQKRRKVKAASTVSSIIVGQLKRFLEMPLDILFEVCSHLTMLDLLHMSRTSRPLRNCVMSRKWISVWRSALENDPDVFPVKPDGISEPQYASLLFDAFCFNCLKTDVNQGIFWCTLQRLCDNCASEVFIAEGDAQHFWRSKVNDGPVVGQALNITAEFTLLRDDIISWRRFYLKKELEEVLDAVQQCPDAVAVERFRKSRQRITQSHCQLRDACSAAFERRQLRIANEVMAAKIARRENISRRLRASGFTEELKYISEKCPHEFNFHRDVDTADHVTDDVFKSILPRLTTLMLNAREKVLNRKRKRLYSPRLQLFADMLASFVADNPLKISPSLADIAIIPEVKTILDNQDVNAFIDQTSVAHIKGRLPTICKEWRREKNIYLASIMPRSLNISHLSLAAALFQCNECLHPIPYPNILVHQCLRNLRTGYRNREESQVTFLEALGEEPWNYKPRDGVHWHPHAFACAVDVIRACNLQPETASPGDMDRASVQWIECVDCRDTKKKRSLVCQWRNAIVHGLQHLNQGCAARWRPVAGENDVNTAYKEEERQLLKFGRTGSYFICVHCDAKVERGMRKEHLRLIHDTDKSDNLQCVFTLTYNAPMITQPSSVTIPLVKIPSKPTQCIDLTGDTTQDIIEID